MNTVFKSYPGQLDLSKCPGHKLVQKTLSISFIFIKINTHFSQIKTRQFCTFFTTR
jgi:hypothetical protein